MSGAFAGSVAPLRAAATGRPVVSGRGRAGVVSVRAETFSVRPYTVRSGDTLTSIARKRGFTVEELSQLNHDIDPDSLTDGQTIILPAGALSARDKEILDGIGRFSYRTYPVRKGEDVNAIISKRGINWGEMERLNPGVNLKKVGENTILKLPAGKYTVREREMMVGSGIVPQEFFSTEVKLFGTGFALGAAVLGGVLYWVRHVKQSGLDSIDED